MNYRSTIGFLIALLFFAAPALSAENENKPESPDHAFKSMPTIPLADVFDSAIKKSGKTSPASRR
jgi:hypothetical protein